MRPLALLLALALAPAAFAQTNVGGSIAADSTWSLAGSPYNATATVTVQSGATLTIEPGVTVVFSAGRQLVIHGGLVARGTEGAPILFTTTSPTPGYWRGIRFSTTSVDAVYDGAGEYVSGSILEHCRLEYGGNWQIPTSAIDLENASPALRHLVIDDSGSTGILENRTEPAPPLRLRDVTIDLPIRYGIDLTGGSGHVLERVRVIGPLPGVLFGDPVGFEIESADSVLMDGCRVDDVSGDPFHRAIRIRSSTGSIVRDCYTEDSSQGVFLQGTDNLVLRHHAVRGGGIRLSGTNSRAGRVEDCDLMDGGGVSIGSSQGGEILNNRVSGAVGRGLAVSYSDDVLVRHNTAIDGTGGGAEVFFGTNVRFEENRIVNNDGTPTGGIFVRESDGLVLVGNDLSHNRGHDIGGGWGVSGNLFYITAGSGSGAQNRFTVDFSGAPDGSDYNTFLDTTSTGYTGVVTDSIEVIADRACWVHDHEALIFWSIYRPDAPVITVSPFYTDCSSLLGTPGDDARAMLPLAVRPNPMSSRAVLSFSLAESGPVSLRAYDVTGCEVARLAEGPHPAGPQEIVWDGRSDSGRALGAGIYLIRLVTAQGTAVRKVVRIAP